MHFKSMLEAFTLFALYVIVASNCHKIWCLQLLLDKFHIAGWTFLVICPRIACLTSELSLLVEIGSEDRIVWITEKTSTYSCVGAWNCIRKKYPKVKWWRSSSDRGGATVQNFKNSIILCISIKNIKYLVTKIEVGRQMFELVQWCS